MAEFDDRNQGRQGAVPAVRLSSLLPNTSLQSAGVCRPQAGNLQPGIVAIRRCPGSAQPIIETGPFHRATYDGVVGNGFHGEQGDRKLEDRSPSGRERSRRVPFLGGPRQRSDYPPSTRVWQDTVVRRWKPGPHVSYGYKWGSMPDLAGKFLVSSLPSADNFSITAAMPSSSQVAWPMFSAIPAAFSRWRMVARGVCTLDC